LAVVTAVSVGAQIYSLDLLRGRLEFSLRINDAVGRAASDPVVSDLWWVPQELSTVILERPVFLVRSPRMLPVLLERLCNAGYRRYLMVTDAAGGRQRLPGSTRVEDTRFGFFAVELVPGRTCRE